MIETTIRRVSSEIILRRDCILATDSVVAGALLSHFIDIWNILHHKEFYRTDKEVLMVIPFTRKELDDARRLLIDKNFILIVPPSCYYLINDKAISDAAWKVVEQGGVR